MKTLLEEKKKWPENLNSYFSKEDIQIANRNMKRYSTSLIIREIHIKTMKHHLTPVRITIIKKSTNNKCWRRWRKKELYYNGGGHIHWCSFYGKKCGVSSKN